MSSCDTCLVRNRAICSALSEPEVGVLNTIGRHRHLEPGQSLIWEDEDSVLVANVIEGVLKLSAGTEDGREQIVGVVYPSEFIGRPFGTTNGHGVTVGACGNRPLNQRSALPDRGRRSAGGCETG